MTNTDRKEFELYLQQCTDNQVQGVLEKETLAKRQDYAQLAREEILRRTGGELAHQSGKRVPR